MYLQTLRGSPVNRTLFVRSLIGAVGASQLLHATAALALDEREVGREVFLQLRDDGEVLFDSQYYEHLNAIGEVISNTVRSRYEFPIRYYIVKGDSPNAFSVPGGNIYVNEPLLRLAKNRDEVAGVIAHETGHMVLHHVAKRVANNDKASTLSTIGGILARVFGGPLGGAASAYALGNLGAAQAASLSRHIEAQADEEGARILAATNYFNPYGLIWFLDIMTATYGAGKNDWMIDHPLDGQRIDDLRHLFASDPATFGKFKDNESRDVAYW
jgi:predicted Zn-dependent protease